MIAVEIIKVIKIDVCEGNGTEKDPCRKVYYYYTENGELLFKKDPCRKGGGVMKTITLEFELQQGNYKLITNDNILQGFGFSVDDLLNKEKAEDTQSKLEYILYRKRNEVNVNDSRRNV